MRRVEGQILFRKTSRGRPSTDNLRTYGCLPYRLYCLALRYDAIFQCGPIASVYCRRPDSPIWVLAGYLRATTAGPETDSPPDTNDGAPLYYLICDDFEHTTYLPW
jgi:hypothetical protein